MSAGGLRGYEVKGRKLLNKGLALPRARWDGGARVRDAGAAS